MGFCICDWIFLVRTEQNLRRSSIRGWLNPPHPGEDWGVGGANFSNFEEEKEGKQRNERIGRVCSETESNIIVGTFSVFFLSRKAQSQPLHIG